MRDIFHAVTRQRVMLRLTLQAFHTATSHQLFRILPLRISEYAYDLHRLIMVCIRENILFE